MIHGIGIDLVETERVKQLYRKHPDRTLRRILTDPEQSLALKQHSPIGRLAKYIAAKEACFKALGIGRDQGIGWKDMEVAYHETGQPYMTLSERASAHLPEGYAIHLSLTDTDDHAAAYVVIELP